MFVKILLTGAATLVVLAVSFSFAPIASATGTAVIRCTDGSCNGHWVSLEPWLYSDSFCNSYHWIFGSGDSDDCKCVQDTPIPQSVPTLPSYNQCHTLTQENSFSVTCGSSGQLCSPSHSISVNLRNPSPLTLTYIVNGHCSSVRAHVLVDGIEQGVTSWMGWIGGYMNGVYYPPSSGTLLSTVTIPNVSAGNHTISLQAEGTPGGCNISGKLYNWGGKIDISASQDQCAPVCNSHSYKQCSGNAVYWYNSCGNQQDLYQQCTTNQVCQNAQCITLVKTADLSISKTGPATTTKGAVISYTVTVVNHGPDTAPNVQVGDTIPAGLIFNASASNPACQSNGTLVNCTQASLANGQSISFTIAFNVPANIACNTVLQNVAATLSSAVDPNTANNHVSIVQGPVRTTVLCPVCSYNSDCGNDSFIGGPFCQSGNVYKNYKTYTCNNPGTANAYCSNSTTAQLQTTCTSGQVCSNGTCNNVTCSTNPQCGTDSFIGSPFCQGNNVYRNYKTYICNNPGTSSSYCSNSTTAQLQTTCTANQTCSGGNCITNNLVVSCAGTPNPANTNQQVSFAGIATGGTGSYNYSWTGACVGSSPACSNSFTSAGTYTAYLNVTSGTQTASASCAVVVNQSCVSHLTKQCVGNSIYWFNSCGYQQDLYQQCTINQTCCNGQCVNNCTPNATKQCVGNAVYNFDSCGVQGSLYQQCTANQTCQNAQCVNNCTSHASKQCVGNSVYWYNSCGTQQDLYQTCTGNQTCSNGQCVTNCITHDHRACVGRDAYWFNSCNAQEGLAEDCGFGSCQNGNCILNSFSLSCTANPTQAYTNQPVSFNSYINLPTNNVARSTNSNPTYYYTWSGACSGTSSICSTAFGTSGNKTANLSVTIGNVTQTATCSATIFNSNCNGTPCAH